MSIFEIKGNARREVACDIAVISINFKAVGQNPYEISQKVMKDCDDFIEKMSRLGFDIKDIHMCDDGVEDNNYRDDYKMSANRKIIIKTVYDMKTINCIQSVLQQGKYDYELDVDGDLSSREALKLELTKEALLNSKKEAEQLAEVLGMKVKGVDSLVKERWDDCTTELARTCCPMGETNSRPSDLIGAQMTDESIDLKVKWILE